MSETGQTVHVFERAGLGKAPFRFRGAARVVYQACPGAPIQPGGSCDYCGQAISIHCTIESSDGKRFKVGSDCVAKTGDAGLRKVATAVAKLKAKEQTEREAARVRAAEEKLSDPELREKLESQPHPRGFTGQTMLDWVNWMLAHAGHTGRLQAARVVEKTA